MAPGQIPRGIDVVGAKDFRGRDQVAEFEAGLNPGFTNEAGPSAPSRRYLANAIPRRLLEYVI